MGKINTIRINKTKRGNTIAERQEAAERDYDVAEYIKTTENSIIKDSFRRESPKIKKTSAKKTFIT